jgi:hypothetical protein
MVSKENKLIALMPPKTASNSIREILQSSGIEFDSPNGLVTFPLIHLKLNEITKIFEIENLSEYKIIQIIRCPYQRYISAYLHQLKILNNSKSVIFHNYSLLEFTEHLSTSIKSDNFISTFYGDRTFVDRSIKNRIHWGGSRLFDTQRSWGSNEFNIHYFKLETISNDFSPISNLLSINPKFIYNINKSNQTRIYESLLTSEIKHIVSDIFDDDFNYFNYSK